MNDWFTKEQVGFWGSLAIAAAAYFKYKTASLKQKEDIMSGEKLGIKETKEVLEAGHAVTLEIVKLTKDGIQVTDAITLATDLLMNPAFKEKIVAAIENIKQVPAEIKDLDVMEIVEITKYEFENIPKIIEALKG